MPRLASYKGRSWQRSCLRRPAPQGRASGDNGKPGKAVHIHRCPGLLDPSASKADGVQPTGTAQLSYFFESRPLGLRPPQWRKEGFSPPDDWEGVWGRRSLPHMRGRALESPNEN